MMAVLAALHARGFHAAVLAGLVMMPAVVAAGFLSDRATRIAGASRPAPIRLRGSFDDLSPSVPEVAPHS